MAKNVNIKYLNTSLQSSGSWIRRYEMVLYIESLTYEFHFVTGKKL